jgi:acetate kinase
MGGLDAIVFTGGIGENDALTRAESLQGLEFLGVELDSAKNQASETVISKDSGPVKAFVIRTDEEAMMAELAGNMVKGER